MRSIPGLSRTQTFVLPLLLSMLLPLSIQAEGKRIALVIGNGDYSDMPKLNNPVNDVQDIASVLQKLGFDVTPLYNANRKQIDKAINAFREALSQDRQNEGFFYYAGHGIQAKGVNYLIPIGADVSTEADLDDEAVSLQRVLGNIEEANNKVNIVVLDACRNNPLPAKARSAGRGLAVVASAPPESIVLFSTAANETAQDGAGRNSPFAKALIDHLADPGDIGQTIRSITAEVKSQTNGKQTPFQYTSIDFAVSLNPKSDADTSTAGNPVSATPSIIVSRSYGSLSIRTATAGSLFIDGIAVGDFSSGSETKLDNVEAGTHALELRYAGGFKENMNVSVKKGQVSTASFTWKGAPPEIGQESSSSSDMERSGSWADLSDFYFVPGQWARSNDALACIVEGADSFAWSNVQLMGNYEISFNFKCAQETGEALIILNGNGRGFDKGCIIVNFRNGFQGVRLNTIYDGTVYLANANDPLRNFTQKNSVDIQKRGAVLEIYYNGEFFSETKLTGSAKDNGHFGLFKYNGSAGSIEYSNLKYRKLN
jgi:Caspase domain